MKRSLAAALALLAAAACQTPGDMPPRLPGSSTVYEVTYLGEIDGYLDAVLTRGDSQWRYFFPPSEDCRALIRVEKTISWHAAGAFGEAREGDRSCQPVGIGSLAGWRDRRPRGRTTEGLYRGTARFDVAWQDEAWVLVRGRFPYANKIGWPGGWDTLALVPNDEACRPMIEKGSATLEFRVAGRDPFRFTTGEGLCPIRAFLRPLEQG